MCNACYILNWSPKAAPDKKVAEEVWTRKKVQFFQLFDEDLWSTGAFLDSGAGAGVGVGVGVGLDNFWKSRVWVRRLKNY